MPSKKAKQIQSKRSPLKPVQKETKKQADLVIVTFILKEKNPKSKNDAYEKLWKRYRHKLHIFIWKYIKNDQDIEDILQETFVKAFNSLQFFDAKYAFSTWLYRIATNTAIDYLRKKKIQGISLDEELGSEGDNFHLQIADPTFESPFDATAKKQKHEMLKKAIEELPKSYRDIIYMRHIEELSYKEISEKIGSPLGTVKVYIFRAREALYKKIRYKINLH